MRYEAFWGLRNAPFPKATAAVAFFASPTHEEALARLQFLVHNHRTLGVVSGCQGAGRTLVLARFAHQLRENGRTACLVDLPGQDARGLLWSLATGLGANPRCNDDAYILWRRTSDHLRAAHSAGEALTLLFDDADAASGEVRALVLRLLKSDCCQGVTTILTAESSRLHQLETDLLQLSELHVRLEKWTPDEIRDYLCASLQQAGREGNCDIFGDTAVSRLHELTDGIPRYVSQLANLSLVVGAARGLGAIDADTINCIFQELSLGRSFAAGDPSLSG